MECKSTEISHKIKDLLKCVQLTDLLVTFGYIRRHKMEIPPSIINYCALYAYLIIEQFDATKLPDSVMLSNHACTVKQTKTKEVTTYGMVPILSTSKMIHEWKFLINRFGSSPAIGIEQIEGREQPRHRHKLFYYSVQSDIINYAFDNEALKWSQGTLAQSYGSKYNDGDTVEMILNLSNGTLSYEINDKDQGVCFNVKQEADLYYILAIALFDIDDSITLLKYSKHT